MAPSPGGGEGGNERGRYLLIPPFCQELLLMMFRLQSAAESVERLVPLHAGDLEFYKQ
jgi:hypothetical protein